MTGRLHLAQLARQAGGLATCSLRPERQSREPPRGQIHAMRVLIGRSRSCCRRARARLGSDHRGSDARWFVVQAARWSAACVALAPAGSLELDQDLHLPRVIEPEGEQGAAPVVGAAGGEPPPGLRQLRDFGDEDTVTGLLGADALASVSDAVTWQVIV